MTQSHPDQPRTALAVLCGPGPALPQAAADEVIAPAIRVNPQALARVPEGVRVAAVGAIAATAAGLLGFSLAESVVEGWREHRDLIAAARRTLATPGSREVVRLGTHQITVTRQPYVTVRVNGQEVARVDLELVLTFVVTVLVAVVSAGRLTALQSGCADVTAVLAVQGAEVLNRWAQIDLPGTISLREGIRLLPERDYLEPPPHTGRLPGETGRDAGAPTQIFPTAKTPAEQDSASAPTTVTSFPWLRSDQERPR